MCQCHVHIAFFPMALGTLDLDVLQEAQGLGALLDKMEENDRINWITQRSRCIFHSKTCRDTSFFKIRNTHVHRMTPE